MNKYGLVLGGGGAKGAYQVGVLKALEEAKMLRHVRVMSGTSIGAINTYLLMNGLDATTLGEIWNKFDNDTIYGKNRVIDTFDVLGFYNTEGIVDNISHYLNPRHFQKTKISGYATLARVPEKSFFARFNFKNYEKEVVRLNDADKPLKTVMASAAIPFVFGEKTVEGHRYVDGGVVDNLPFGPLIGERCNVIFAIGLNAKEMRETPMRNVMWIDFTPDVDFGALKAALDFDPVKIFNYYTLGYENAKQMIAYLKRKKIMWFFGRTKRKNGLLINMADVNNETIEY